MGPKNYTAKEFKLVSMRETLLPADMAICDTPEKVADYYERVMEKDPRHTPDSECFYIILLNTRRRVAGHLLLSIGTIDTIIIDARKVFRPAIVHNASAIVLIHNHPSGESTPSEADIKVTRDLMRAGQLLKVEVVDHVIMGNRQHSSLRNLGYFYNA